MKNLVPFILFITISISSFSQQPQKRIALVIGSQNYTVLPKLRNSLSDAKAISTTLQGKGFQVKSIYDPQTRKEIKDGINWYFNQMRDQEGAVGLIYYAGHGMQYHGDNYIIPTTASLQNPSDLDDYCVKMNGVMEIINSASKSLNILLLDACRSLPSFTRGSDQGLSKMSPPEGSIIVFATTAGKVADDGTGSHGLFTAKLLNAMNEPGLNVNDVFRKVQREVYMESKKQQLPELDDLAVGGDFYFTPVTKTEVRAAEPISPSVVNNETPKTVSLDYNKNPQLPALLVLSLLPIDLGYGVSGTASVKIGKQEWITRNLNVDHFANGDQIPEAKTPKEWIRANEKGTPAWCYYDNNPDNEQLYGKLYNWFAINEPRGLVPKGWHVPNDTEWNSLMIYLGGESMAGVSLKSTFGWYGNGNGNNASGIEGFPGGYRYVDGVFHNFGRNGIWGSSSESTQEKAWAFAVSYKNGSMTIYDNYKGCGYSVRCVKD